MLRPLIHMAVGDKTDIFQLCIARVELRQYITLCIRVLSERFGISSTYFVDCMIVSVASRLCFRCTAENPQRYCSFLQVWFYRL